MTFKDIAYKILKEENSPLHVKEITKIALKNGLETSGRTPERTMGVQLTTDVNNKGDLSRFKKVGPSTFAINEKQVNIDEDSKSDRIIEEIENEEIKDLEGGYTGKAGEYAVLSELLFRGYNSALMSVDTGIDIIAKKNNETFNIQVKTRNISRKHNAFFFNIRVSSFERHNTGRTFYILILRNNNKLDYLILPLSEIEEGIERDFVYVAGNGSIYRIAIRKRDGKVYLGRKENDVSYYLNRWDIIK